MKRIGAPTVRLAIESRAEFWGTCEACEGQGQGEEEAHAGQTRAVGENSTAWYGAACLKTSDRASSGQVRFNPALGTRQRTRDKPGTEPYTRPHEVFG